MSECYILQVPVISTAHLPSAEAVNDAEVLFAQYENGWFVYIDDELEPGMPQWYANVWRWAKHKHFHWVRFDSDGDYISSLEKYEW